eukprot:2969644-Pleurochrysis_carterae.AAC.17
MEQNVRRCDKTRGGRVQAASTCARRRGALEGPCPGAASRLGAARRGAGRLRGTQPASPCPQRGRPTVLQCRYRRAVPS